MHTDTLRSGLCTQNMCVEGVEGAFRFRAFKPYESTNMNPEAKCIIFSYTVNSQQAGSGPTVQYTDCTQSGMLSSKFRLTLNLGYEFRVSVSIRY